MSINKSKVSIGCDHAGFELKEWIKEQYSDALEFEDFGAYSLDSVDYPDFAHRVSESIENGQSQWGILICGSANGISMAANKHQGIRAAVCWKPEIASLARQHNDANIITLPARFIEKEEAKNCIDAFIKHEFEGGRHQRRVDKISC